MISLVEKQAPIDKEIADALIVATPEIWKSAEMFVERHDDGAQERMNISISSPEGHKEPISPTEEIYEGLYRLSDLFREHAAMWRTVRYVVSQKDGGDWSYSVRFEY